MIRCTRDVDGTGLPIHGQREHSDGAPFDLNYFRQAGTSPLECWYSAMIGTTALAAGATSVRNIIFALPFVAPRGGTLDRIGVRVTATAGAGNARAAIYAATSATNLYPDALVLDSGDLSAAAVAVVTATISQTLTAGNLYWLCTNVQNNSIGLQGIPVAALWPILGVDNTLGTAGVGLTVALAFGAYPATFPGSATAITTGLVHAAWVRYSA